ncbi:hypothetical protein Fmac_020978 [Flemingia macrophylla]|uniref:Pectinesterase n=1 Tax=Flemingia macrophylla TaxID=520843 RepID=A0ABD1LVL1_9FABA
MAFQDFDVISERRKNAAKLRLRKKILISVVSAVLLACIVGAAAFVVVQRTGATAKNAASAKPAPRLDQNSRLVGMICSSAVYKVKCETTLGEALKKDPNLGQPKDLLLVSMVVAENEINKAFNATSKLTFASEEEKGAYEDCKQLFEDAKEELGFSINQVGEVDTDKLSSKAPDLNNWLSAVMSYQQTCIDGFPEGKLKNQFKNAFNESRELVSNALAVVSQVSSFFSIFKGAGNFHLPWETDSNGGASAPLSGPDGARARGFDVVGAAPRAAPGAAAPGLAPTPLPDLTGPIPAWAVPVPAWSGPPEFKASDQKLVPNVTVAQDGSGNFKTISEALAAIPPTYEGRYVVYVKTGVYDETVTVTKKMINLTMFGDGMDKSIITGNKNYVDGVRTFQTASFVVLGDGFLGKDMGFQNTAGAAKHQAVAARVQADQAVFYNCLFDGYQDTLYAQTHRQYYRDCVITGTIDFIFGDASAVFQNCTMVVRKPLENQQNIVTAQGRIDKQEDTGFVLQKCVIKAADDLAPETKNYLGRPWKEFSRTIIMESQIDNLIHPDGWLPWEGDFALNTLYYGEYNNNGVGANTNARVPWPTRHNINRDEATRYTIEAFLQGTWINSTGVPAQLGLYS